MTDLADWLLAQIADDEAAARAAAKRQAVLGFWPMQLDDPWPEVEAHIARHDPARVLAECAAKRAIVEDCSDILGDPDEYDVRARDIAYDHLRWLAQPYADRAGFDPAWKVGT